MSRLVFLNIAWMKKYRGMADDKPANGGKFVGDTGTAYECYNFFPVNHFCHGYCAVGNKLDLGRVDEIGKTSDVVQDVTIIWVANRKIVGWYEYAEIYRYWQSFNEPEFDKNHTGWDHICKAREENVFLIPPEERNFNVPSAAKNGAGKGLGQSNIWYADSAWAQEIFIPAVEKYLESLRGKYPIEYLTTEEINKKIAPTKIAKQELLDRACNMLEIGQHLRALKVFNYLIYNYLSPYKIVLSKFYRGLALEKILFYDEAIETYKRVLWEFEKLEDDEKDYPLDLDCTFNLARIYEVMNKRSAAYPLWRKIFEEDTDISIRCDALRRMMWTCEFEEDWTKLQELLKIYDDLNTTEFIDDVKELKKVLRKAKREMRKNR